MSPQVAEGPVGSPGKKSRVASAGRIPGKYVKGYQESRVYSLPSSFGSRGQMSNEPPGCGVKAKERLTQFQPWESLLNG